MTNSTRQDGGGSGGQRCRRSGVFTRWLILPGLFMASFLELGSARTLSLFLDDFTFQFDVSTSYIGAIYGLATGMPYFLAFITVPLLRYFSVRQLTMLGGIFVSGGLIAASFTTSAPQITAALILSGFGWTFIFLPTSSSPAEYFPDLFEIVTGVAFSGASVGVMVMPWLFDTINAFYGWRGGLLMLGALNSQYILIGSLLKPTKGRRTRKNAHATHDGGKSQIHNSLDVEADQVGVDIKRGCDQSQTGTCSVLEGSTMSLPSYTDHSENEAEKACTYHGDVAKFPLDTNVSKDLKFDSHLIADYGGNNGFVNASYEADPLHEVHTRKMSHQGRSPESKRHSVIKEKYVKPSTNLSNCDEYEVESIPAEHENVQSATTNPNHVNHVNGKRVSTADAELVEIHITDTKSSDKVGREVADNTCSFRALSSVARFFKGHPKMIIICFQVYLFAFTYAAWVLFTIPNALAKGLSDTRAAQLSIAGGVANFIGRFSCGFITSKERASTEIWYMIANVISSIAFFANYVADSFWFLTVLSVVFGFSIGFKSPAHFTLVMKAVGKEHFKTGVGIIFLIGGSVFPFVGLISDLTVGTNLTEP
ncbi:uncharacterized protein LOC135155257 [Lytechinus pictus]|uniref:uncharacterized protein LOC135155257 n=1 Tax=Lytechinus pictus TaxID=7653 RepID=UPI0030BA045A